MTRSGDGVWLTKRCIATALGHSMERGGSHHRVQTQVIKRYDTLRVRGLTLDQFKVAYAEGMSALGTVHYAHRPTTLLVVRVKEIKHLDSIGKEGG